MLGSGFGSQTTLIPMRKERLELFPGLDVREVALISLGSLLELLHWHRVSISVSILKEGLTCRQRRRLSLDLKVVMYSSLVEPEVWEVQLQRSSWVGEPG